jgi:XTP/dITP diphosphohydrolase
MIAKQGGIMDQIIVIATGNEHKRAEYAALLSFPGYRIVSLRDLGIAADAPEDGTTFTENALQKAQYYAQKSGHITIADDSGISVAALDGAPGVYSARYGTPDLDDRGRRLLLLDTVNRLNPADRSAAFSCVIALVLPDGREYTCTGICTGSIATTEEGTGGFGYDPIFWVHERGCTMASLSAEEKNAISHRGRAVQQLKILLAELLG